MKDDDDRTRSPKVISRRKLIGATAAAAGAATLSPLACTQAPPSEGADRAEPAAVTFPRRPFGNTGVEVPVIGLGGGSRFTDAIPDDEPAADLVRRAIEMGVAYVETGANYGSSEPRIGLAMETHRDGVFIETKVGERDYDGAMREMESSLELMRTGHIELILHHNVRSVEQIDRIAAPGGADEAIRKMIDEGVVSFRGFSCHLPEVTLAGIERLEPDAIQVPLNAVRYPDFEAEVLPMTSERDIAVIGMKTCGHGYFFHENATHIDRLDSFGPPPEAFEQSNLPAAEDYLRYALSLPIATAVVGMDSVYTLEEVVRIATEFRPLTTTEMASITERSQVFRTTGYWIPRA
jgi:aryl-alcohol dehydrogenase-like predicted oxidoreductase